MKNSIASYQQIRAAGTVMEIWPTGNYMEYMPKGTPRQRMSVHWQRIGAKLSEAIKAYDHKADHGR